MCHVLHIKVPPTVCLNELIKATWWVKCFYHTLEWLNGWIHHWWQCDLFNCLCLKSVTRLSWNKLRLGLRFYPEEPSLNSPIGMKIHLLIFNWCILIPGIPLWPLCLAHCEAECLSLLCPQSGCEPGALGGAEPALASGYQPSQTRDGLPHLSSGQGWETQVGLKICHERCLTCGWDCEPQANLSKELPATKNGSLCMTYELSL